MGKVLAQWVKVLIEGLGAIERVEVELKPLTVIVSKCTYFSSSLITALYLLASSYPDFSKLNDFTVTEISRLCERAYSSALKSNIQMLEEYTRKIFDLYLDGIGRLIAGSLSRRFKEFFNVDAANKVLKGFIKVFSDEAPYHVEIEPRGLDLAVSFKPLDKPLAKVEGLRHLGDGLGLSLSLLIGERELARRDMFVKSPLDIASEFAYMTRIFADKLAPISFGSRNSYLFTSDRASIMSDLPIAYGLTLGYGGRRISAKSQALISSYVEAAKKFKAELVEQLEADLNLVLEELGVKSFSLRFMASYPMLNLDLSWRDKVLLEDSPMEVRSCMPVVMSLLSEPSDFEVVFIEDVELNLHPRASRSLMKLLVKSLLHWSSKGKKRFMVISTKSPAVLSALSEAMRDYPSLTAMIEAKMLYEERGRVIGRDISLTARGLMEASRELE